MNAYILGKWIIAPVLAGMALCVAGIVRAFVRCGNKESRYLPDLASASHMRLLLLTLCAVFLCSTVSGLIHEFSVKSPVPRMGLAGGDAARNAATEQVFGRFRTPLREGSFTTFLCVSAIICGVNTISVLTSLTIPGALLVPGVVILGYTGWQQGMEFASLGASTFGSMLGFLWVVGLESSAYVLGAAVGVNFALAVLFPSWAGVQTRKTAFHKSLVTALKLYSLIVAILILQAVSETLYVRQVLLHGGSGVPLAPY